PQVAQAEAVGYRSGPPVFTHGFHLRVAERPGPEPPLPPAAPAGAGTKRAVLVPDGKSAPDSSLPPPFPGPARSGRPASGGARHWRSEPAGVELASAPDLSAVFSPLRAAPSPGVSTTRGPPRRCC